RRQLLIDAVVQVARDAPALLLLRGHETSRKIADRLLALARRARGALSLEGAGERLGQELESRNPFVGPAPLLVDQANRQAAHDRAVPDEGDQDEGPSTERLETLAIDRRLVGEASQPLEADDAALAQLAEHPGRLLFPDHRESRRKIRPGPHVR